MVGNRLGTGEFEHRDGLLAKVIIKLGGLKFFSFIGIRASTPTIVNVSTTDANWTKVSDGLTDVLSWRLVEKTGNDFYYAFTNSPAAFVTGFGWVSENTALNEIWVQRPTDTNIDMQLLIWKI